MRCLILLTLIIVVQPLFAQQHTISLDIANQPNGAVYIGTVTRGKFVPSDTVQAVNNAVLFKLSPTVPAGVLRVILGQTTYAKVMNEAPQQLDMIYNKESIKLKTDFNHPTDSVVVIESLENKVWFNFKQKEQEVLSQRDAHESALDYYREQNDQLHVTKTIALYNDAQNDHAMLIGRFIDQYPQLFASKLIGMCRVPFTDGVLGKRERTELYQANFFDALDFTDEALLNSDVYTKMVFRYFMSYAQRGVTREVQEDRFINAIDVIVAQTNENEKIYESILDYLVDGFEQVGMNTLIAYVADKYEGTTCQSDGVTTFERKLRQQNMKIGMLAPSFTLNNIAGTPVSLTDVMREKTVVIFWASWCPHCNEMMPMIRDYIASQSMQNIEVIAISLDENKEEWENQVSAMGIESWTNLSGLKGWECDVVKQYNVYATPTMFVINEYSAILGKPITLDELRSFL